MAVWRLEGNLDCGEKISGIWATLRFENHYWLPDWHANAIFRTYEPFVFIFYFHIWKLEATSATWLNSYNGAYSAAQCLTT